MPTSPSTSTLRPAGHARTAAPGPPHYAPAAEAAVVSPLSAKPLAARINRLIDVVVATLLLVILAGPLLVIALAIRLTSSGGAFYRQERTGLGGKSFFVYKLRTMRADAEAPGQPVWATHGDPRRTRLGAVLRRLSIDELPQLLNVVRGEMSLVGPRPERPYFVREFAEKFPDYPQRHCVPPGITGWAQINGWRGDSSIEKRLQYDLYYIRNWSLWLNLRILLVTPLVVLFDQNAC